MAFTFRAGTAADIPAMYRLDLLCFEPEFRFDLRSMRRFANEAGAIVIVAEEGAELVGFVIVNVTRRKTVSSGYVTTLDVHPEYRRRGIAAQLMQRAEAMAAAEEIAYLRLHVFTGNRSAIEFYEKTGFIRGFAAVVKGFYGEGLDAWIYVKELKEDRQP